MAMKEMMPANTLPHFPLNTGLRGRHILRKLSPRLGVGHSAAPHSFDQHSPTLEKRRDLCRSHGRRRVGCHIIPCARQLLRGGCGRCGALGERLPIPIRRPIDH
jgi:hypothetical protein